MVGSKFSKLVNYRGFISVWMISTWGIVFVAITLNKYCAAIIFPISSLAVSPESSTWTVKTGRCAASCLSPSSAASLGMLQPQTRHRHTNYTWLSPTCNLLQDYLVSASILPIRLSIVQPQTVFIRLLERFFVLGNYSSFQIELSVK